MQITGKNLALVDMAIDYAISEIHNRIATCPDVHEYADDIAELEALKRRMTALGLRVCAAVGE